MKKFNKFLFLLAFILFFISCKKTNSSNQEQNIKLENGILVFSNFTELTNTLRNLNKINDSDKDKWEKNIGFISFRKLFDQVLDQLSNSNTKDEFDRIIAKNTELITVENDEIKSTLGNNYFAPVVNSKGIVRVGNDYYRFFNSKETIVLDGSEEKVLIASNETLNTDNKKGIYRINFQEKSNNVASRFTCSSGYMSGCVSSNGSNRRGFHNLEFGYYLGIDRDPVTLLPVSFTREGSVYLKFGAQKRILGTWNSYSTAYECSRLLYVTTDGTNIDLNYLSSNGDFRDWYYTLSFQRIVTPYSLGAPSGLCSPDITSFECRATTRGTWPNFCTFTY
ncbi:MAG: hypothetical protein K2X48_17335 [Chitinophagaceae bacterium]|nr:hypothetical protein [Chitinophagaceae bacterium]